MNCAKASSLPAPFLHSFPPVEKLSGNGYGSCIAMPVPDHSSEAIRCSVAVRCADFSTARRAGTRPQGEAPGERANADSPDILLRDFLAANYARLQQRLARHLGCPDMASECLHDAWLRLGDLAIFTSVQSPEAYVYRTACNAAIDRVRSNRSWQYADGADTELDYFADLGPGPDIIAEARSELAAVDRALHRLPHRHRSVLAALCIEDATREEVATRFDLTLRRVDTVLRQALDHCAELAGRSVTGGVKKARGAVARRGVGATEPRAAGPRRAATPSRRAQGFGISGEEGAAGGGRCG